MDGRAPGWAEHAGGPPSPGIEAGPAAGLPRALAEADAAAALAAAEAVRIKMAALGRLEEEIAERGLEGAVRNRLVESPWILDPEWDGYRREARVSRMAEDAARSAGLDGDGEATALSSGGSLLVLVFMRPGLLLDRDRLDRCARYVDHMRSRALASASLRIGSVGGLIVADRLSGGDLLARGVRRLEGDGVRVADWRTLLAAAAARHGEYLAILGERMPGGGRPRGAPGAG